MSSTSTVTVMDGPALAALRAAWVTADRHLTAYGHDMTWHPADGRYNGTCERCSGRVAVIATSAGPQPVAGPAMTDAGHADYAECPRGRR